MRFSTLAILFSLLICWTSVVCAKRPVHVFVLAGQSNMEGQGVVDLDHEEHYNAGRGILNNVIKQSNSELFDHVLDSDGQYVIRDDVFVRFATRQGLKTGGLSIGFTGYPGRHHIGPEFQFGHVVGDDLKQPVLLIKTAWGGKSLYKDFRPPLSGGNVGAYYNQMLEEVDTALENIGSENPELGNRRFKISGFVWFQGWNDMYDEEAKSEYKENLVNLILGIREAFEVSDLPVIIGELGNGGAEANDNMQLIRDSQEKAASDTRVGENVRFVPTHQFAKPANESPNVGHGHHWYGNAESYFMIGDAFGKEMLKLVNSKR